MSSQSEFASNPYNFRTPVRDASRLAGREEELAKIRKHLTSTAGGSPVHVALIGERAAGKTSLLNQIGILAPEHGLIPVRLDLDEGVVDSAFSFFKATFEAVVTALVEHGVLQRSDPRYVAWTRQAYLGDLNVSPAEQLIMFGMLTASFINGASHEDVSPALLKADFDRLISIAQEGNFAGVALITDEADLLVDNSAIIEKLRNLFQALQSSMIVAAGTRRMFSSLTDIFSPIPRQFARIPVGPFESWAAVNECIIAPLATRFDKIPARLFPRREAVADIAALTSGKPYEINLICYYIWESLQDDTQSRFELSTVVLDNVLQELSDVGRQIAVADIIAIRRLTSHDFETAVEVVPYEHLTIRELALQRLMLQDYTEDALRNEIASVEAAVEDLQVLGILTREGDRFSLRGDSFVRIYFKYAASLHTTIHLGHKIAFGASFAHHVVAKAVEKRRQDVPVTQPAERVFAERSRRKELGDPAVGRWLREFQEGARERDLSRMASVDLVPRYNVAKPGPDEKMVFIGSVFSVGVDRLEHGELWPTTDQVHETELMAIAERWMEDNRDLLKKYDTEVQQLFAAVLDSPLTHELLIYADTYTALNEAADFFIKGQYRRSVNAFLEICRVLEQEDKGRDGTITNPNSRLHIGEAYNAAGFVSAAVGDDAVAEKYLRQALQTDNYQRWLRHYNLAYLSAIRGDFRGATALISDAETLFANDTDRSPGLYMLAYFPTPSAWTPPDPKWNVFYPVGPDELHALIKIQRRVYQALAGEVELTSDSVLLQDIEQPLAEGCRRLLAWVEVTIRDNPMGARGWLLGAQGASKSSGQSDSKVQDNMNMAEAYGIKVNTQSDEKEDPTSYVDQELAFVEALLAEKVDSVSELNEGVREERIRDKEDLGLLRSVEGGQGPERTREA